MYESESEDEHLESEFYYPEDTISGDEAVYKKDLKTSKSKRQN